MGTWYIYSLSDPRDGIPRYIGSTNHPSTRLTNHLNSCCTEGNKKAVWIRSLLVAGYLPAMTVLETGTGYGKKQAESSWIRSFTPQDPSLLNSEDKRSGRPANTAGVSSHFIRVAGPPAETPVMSVRHTDVTISFRSLLSFWRRVSRGESCWLWTGSKSKQGYGCMRSSGTQILAHKFSYILHYGPIPEGMILRHSCDTPPCVRPDHLIPGTQQENIREMDAKGRRNPRRGDRCSYSKLTEYQVSIMRKELVGCRRGDQHQLATRFNVSQATVSMIKTGKRRKL